MAGGGKKGPTDRYYPASWLTRVQKDGYSMGTLYIGLFIRRLDSIVKKKKLPGWWSIEARPRPANRRKEETIAAGVDVKFMTGCKHGNSLSLSLPRSFYHSFQILPSDSHRQIAPRGRGRGGRDEETRAWN